jgi:signal transduction histidine kinase/ActR/RegA family two-component response regulator
MNIAEQVRAFVHRTIGSGETQRHWLLLCCLLGAGGNNLLFYFVPQPGYDHTVNLVAAAIFFGLALGSRIERTYTWMSNLALLTAVLLMGYVTASTGGINSPAMVWMTILAVPALLLLGRGWALFWLTLIMLVILAQYVAVTLGWLPGWVDQSPGTIVWALLDKVLVLLSLMLVVTFYDGMHQRQMHDVALRNADLEATQLALRQAQSHKDEFIASVGHELRTPMNAILGLNGVLLSELADQPENAQIARHIRDSTRQLLRLVNDILDFSQLQAGRLGLLEKPLYLYEAVQRIVAPHEARARDKGLHLVWSVDPWLPPALLLDAQRLEQVLDNLLDNAVKFTAQGMVRLSVRIHNDRLRFEVEDTGRGIAPAHQRQVFTRFEHADAQTKRAYGGTGLGLAICEHLVRLQGGEIGVRSQPDAGALFWFELPLRPAQAPAHGVDKLLPPLQALRFLLVDDNAVNLMVARLVLEKNWPDAQVLTASGGEQALALLDTQDVDLVFMDMVMPGLDGLETTQRLRRHVRAEVARLPVVGLTANTHSFERERCLGAGMNEVLAKPMDDQSVKNTVQALLYGAVSPSRGKT